MSTPDGGSEGEREESGEGERVNVFRVDDHYLFRHFFEGEEVFDRLKRYYENQEYRFAVPASRFEQVRAFLDDNGYDLREVDAEPYAVVCRKYRSHPENVFKAAVFQRSVGDYNVFVLRDRDSVETAVEEGATPLTETDLELDVE